MRNSEAQAFIPSARSGINRAQFSPEKLIKPLKKQNMTSKNTKTNVFAEQADSSVYSYFHNSKELNWQGIGVQIANGVANALAQKVDAYDVVPILTQFFSSVNSPTTLKASAEGIRIRTHTARVVINEPGTGYLRKAPNFHFFERKDMDDSKRDGQDNISDQITKSGYDEKVIDFLDHKSFISLKELFHLVKLDTKIKEQLILWDKKNDDLAVKVSNSTSKIIRETFDNNTYSRFLNKRFLAYVRYIETELTVHNDAIAYKSYVTVYVCMPHMYKDCDEKFSSIQINELYEKILKETQVVEIRSMKPSQILWREGSENESYKNWPFKLSMGVEPSATLEHSQALREHVQIVKKLRFELRPSEKAVTTVRHNFTKGLELFHSNRYASNDSPAAFFFIVETVGSPSRISFKKDPEQKRSGGTAPIQNRYEIKNIISYLANEGSPDEPLTRILTERNKEFEDGDLRNEFYPTRQSHKNIPRENIDVTGRNKKAEWILDIDLSQTNTPTILEAAYSLTDNAGLSLEVAKDIIKNYSDKNKSSRNANEEDSDVIDIDIDSE